MCNVASVYSILGRQEDALMLHEQTLELKRRVLPENHPDIALSCLKISVIVGDITRALEMAREALRIYQATLPPSHPHVQNAQENLRLMSSRVHRA